MLDCCVHIVLKFQIGLGTKTPKKRGRFETNFNEKSDGVCVILRTNRHVIIDL